MTYKIINGKKVCTCTCHINGTFPLGDYCICHLDREECFNKENME